MRHPAGHPRCSALLRWPLLAATAVGLTLVGAACGPTAATVGVGSGHPTPGRAPAHGPHPPAGTAPGWHPRYRGTRLTVTVAGGCPPASAVAGTVTVANPGGGSPQTLVPITPTAARICRYAAAGGRGRLRRYEDRRLGPAAARLVAAALDRIRSARPVGAISCPAAFPSTTLIAFAGTGGSRAALWWEATGCQTIDNGNLAAFQLNRGFAAFDSAVAPHLTRSPGP